jgi:hypothetical protein
MYEPLLIVKPFPLALLQRTLVSATLHVTMDLQIEPAASGVKGSGPDPSHGHGSHSLRPVRIGWPVALRTTPGSPSEAGSGRAGIAPV